MRVHTSEIGHYDIHYLRDTTIEVQEEELKPLQSMLKVENLTRFVPMLVSTATVIKYNLASAVVWRSK